MGLTVSQKIFKEITDFLKIFLALSGFVPNPVSIARIILMLSVFFISLWITNYASEKQAWALSYFLISTSVYISFIYIVLPQNGLRHWFIKTYGGEQKGYVAYETVLGCLFFLNGSSLGFISSAFPGTVPFDDVIQTIIDGVAIILFLTGFVIKIWATKVVSVGIYYWKDMFLGRKIRDFVVRGPYKYVNNPMYGLGHLTAYGVALWYFSFYGLIATIINQVAVFSFYFLVEKKFIRSVYSEPVQQV